MSTPPIIIIYEPDPMLSGILRVEFSRSDFAVLLAGDAEEAETFASCAVASLVVLDFGKSVIGSLATCARIRRSSGYAGRPIVLTGNDMSEKIKTASERAGATVILQKPYSVMDMFQAVTPFVPPDDPLMAGQVARFGMAERQEQIWKLGSAPDYRSGDQSALARNGLLLPIFRGSSRKIPMMGKV